MLLRHGQHNDPTRRDHRDASEGLPRPRVQGKRPRAHGRRPQRAGARAQRGSADEWREWEKIDPPKDLFRTVVERDDGQPVATAEIGPGSFPRPDGAQSGSVAVGRAARRKGIGSALLAVIEAEAARRKTPRILSGTSVAFEGALDGALQPGYKEIGRRIESYVDVKAFDGRPLKDVLDRVEGSGIRLATITELLRGKDADATERFWRSLWEAEAPMWEDVPWAT